MNPSLTLKILPESFAVCRLEADAEIPQQVLSEPFFAVVHTDEELSIVLPERNVNPAWQVECGWRALKVLGPLDFGMIGVLSSIAAPLARAEISIFVISTYDTDYLMVKKPLLDRAAQVLREQGFILVQ
jgi:hypothetical protein